MWRKWITEELPLLKNLKKHVQDFCLGCGLLPRSSYIDAVIPFIDDVMPVVAMLRGRGRRVVGALRRRTPPRPPPDIAEEGREVVLFSRDNPTDKRGVKRLVDNKQKSHEKKPRES